MAEIAKTDLGACRVCGVNVEQGEWADVSKTLGVKHSGCTSWRNESAITAETVAGSGYLFSQPEAATIDHARQVLGIKSIEFDGVSLMGIDKPRLSIQLVRIFELMRDGEFRSLSAIAQAVDCLETSASARLRDFRKKKFGSHQVISRKVEGVTPLTFEYALIVNEQKLSDEDRDDERRDAA